MNRKTPMQDSKSIETIILDAGPLITNTPSISTLLASSQQVVTLPAVLAEIRDESARNRVEHTVKPFLQLREPQPSSVNFVTAFARRTGDLAVLSKVDLSLLALTYEIECEKNGGDWRLRKSPGQKELNGPAPEKSKDGSNDHPVEIACAKAPEVPSDGAPFAVPADGNLETVVVSVQTQPLERLAGTDGQRTAEDQAGPTTAPIEELTEKTSDLSASKDIEPHSIRPSNESHGQNEAEPTTQEQDGFSHPSDESTGSLSDSEGWITPSNLQKHQYHALKSKHSGQGPQSAPSTLQAALITTDNALQNVALQINLNVLSTSASLPRIRHLRTYILRCHACFQTTKEMSRQFCARCGKPTLTRVACSTDASTGKCKLHLKRNMQWNSRGDRYSIPKPVAGTSNGKLGSKAHGGGKGGWGQSLVLAEDQKEYVRAVDAAGRERGKKERDLMSEDALPGILTGARTGGGGRINVGAGRNVNAKKRR